MIYRKNKKLFPKIFLTTAMMGLLFSPFAQVSAATMSTSRSGSANPYAFNIQNASNVFSSVVGCTVTTNSISNMVKKIIIKGEKFGAKTSAKFQDIFQDRKLQNNLEKAIKDSTEPGSEAEENAMMAIIEKQIADDEKATAEERAEAKKKYDAWVENIKENPVEKPVLDFNEATTKTGSVAADPVTDKLVEANTKGTFDMTKAIKYNTEVAKAEAEEQRVREQCLNGVAYALAKQQLAKITNDTLSWVNTGLGGDPFFVRDQISYLNKIADKKLIEFLTPISSNRNSSIYPYGRNFARGAILNRQSTFQQRSVNTMPNYLPRGATMDTWGNNFSQGGGWNAWFAFTQNPANNPLGYQLMATEELAKEQSQAQESAKSEISNGFLPDKKCVEWAEPGSKEEEAFFDKQIEEIVTQREAEKDGTANGYSTRKGYTETGPSGQNVCLKYEIVTPGSVIENQVNTTLTSSIRQLELADSLNESLDFLFQGLMTKLMSKGLKGLDTMDTSSNANTNGSNWSNFYDSLGNNISSLPGYNNNTDVLSVNKGFGFNANDFDLTIGLGDISGPIYYEGCFAPSGLIVPKGVGQEVNPPKNVVNAVIVPCAMLDKENPTWFSTNECSDGIDNDKDGTVDGSDAYCKIERKGVVKRGLITLQKDYIEAIKKSKKVLPKVLPALGELDYCIPGPNPGWEGPVREEVNASI